jgi:hypothetical protein
VLDERHEAATNPYRKLPAVEHPTEPADGEAFEGLLLISEKDSSLPFEPLCGRDGLRLFPGLEQVLFNKGV